MGYPDTFEGFCVAGPKTWNEFKKHELKPKPFGDNDVDVQIEACGVCGSDVQVSLASPNMPLAVRLLFADAPIFQPLYHRRLGGLRRTSLRRS